MKPRGRPQTTQRWYVRTPNLGLRFDFAMSDFLAIVPLPAYEAKGVKYAGEYIRRKAGKAGKVGAKA